MSAIPAMVAMFYGALPPEVNTGRLMAGAGVAPMYQAAAGWEVLAISLETQAEELAGSLAALTGSWQGVASEQAVTATTPMVVWLRTAALQAQKRAMQAIAQASSYSLAMATTPPLPEIEMNHVTHAVLEATNFLGVNTVPIGFNESDYFVRMWSQAAGAMEGYQAETSLNTVFEPILPMTPIVLPGVGESALGMAAGRLAASMPGTVARETAFAHTTAQATVESAGLLVGRVAAQFNQGAVAAESVAQKAQNATQQAGRQSQQEQVTQQGMQQGLQMASQVGSTLTQLPQQLMQGVTQPMQQLTQPLQQVSSLFSQMGNLGGERGAQIGLIGASPFSNHPLIGGSGATSGAGLVRAASLPGAGGTLARTPLLSGLVAQPETPTVATGAAGGNAGSGLAPVNQAGGGAPTGGTGHAGKGGSTKQGLQTPSLLAHDFDEDEEDDW